MSNFEAFNKIQIMKYLLRLYCPLFYFNYTYSQNIYYIKTNNGVLLNKSAKFRIYLNSNNDNFYLDLNDNILP